MSGLKKNAFIVSLLLFVNIIRIAQAQEVTVNLSLSADKSASAMICRVSSDTLLVAHVPFKKYAHWSLRKMAFYNVQAIYENLKDNATAKKSFIEFTKRYSIDTTYLTKQKIAKNHIYLCSAIDEKGQKHVIIDANNNLDFADDNDYVFDKAKPTRPLPLISATIDYFDGSIVRPAIVDLQIDPFNTMFDESYYKSAVDKELDVTINAININKTGTLTVNSKPFKVTVLNFDRLHPNSSFNLNIQKIPYEEKNSNNYIYKKADTLIILKNLYTVKALKNDILYLNYVGRSSSSDGQTGTLAPDITSVDIQTNASFNLNSHKSQYVLLDFWGSWCIPCIRLMPELKQLHEKYKDQITFVSIAYDKASNRGKVLNLIHANSMNWTQLFDDRDKSNSITDRYKVNEFPTSILIDPAGEIIFRGTADMGLRKLIEAYGAASNKNQADLKQ